MRWVRVLIVLNAMLAAWLWFRPVPSASPAVAGMGGKELFAALVDLSRDPSLAPSPAQRQALAETLARMEADMMGAIPAGAWLMARAAEVLSAEQRRVVASGLGVAEGDPVAPAVARLEALAGESDAVATPVPGAPMPMVHGGKGDARLPGVRDPEALLAGLARVRLSREQAAALLPYARLYASRTVGIHAARVEIAGLLDRRQSAFVSARRGGLATLHDAMAALR